MKRAMITVALTSGALTLFLAVLHAQLSYAWLFSLLITAGTVFYHFAMRLAVGYAVDGLCHNRIDYTRAWFRPRPFEKRLYGRLGVRRWMKKLPTFAPDTFSTELHSWEEIAGATCQAEIVHELIALLSFLPIATIPFFGAPAVFIVTSLLSAAYDLRFVCIQRYNRPMLLRQIARHTSSKT